MSNEITNESNFISIIRNDPTTIYGGKNQYPKTAYAAVETALAYLTSTNPRSRSHSSLTSAGRTEWCFPNLRGGSGPVAAVATRGKAMAENSTPPLSSPPLGSSSEPDGRP